MQKNIYQLSVILVLIQSHAAEYQFVSASAPLAGQERTKLGSVAVVATSDPARYGFQKSKGRTGQATDGAGTRAHAVLQAGLSSDDSLLALESIAWSPVAAVLGAISEGTRKVAPDALAESEADLLRAMAQMANQSLLRDRLEDNRTVMRGLLITRSPLQSNRSLSLPRFQWERFGAPAHDPLDTQRTREPDQFPLPARSGEWIKVRGISVGILMLSQNESRDTWGARPPRAQWLALSLTTFASVGLGSLFGDSPRFGVNRRGRRSEAPGAGAVPTFYCIVPAKTVGPEGFDACKRPVPR